MALSTAESAIPDGISLSAGTGGLLLHGATVETGTSTDVNKVFAPLLVARTLIFVVNLTALTGTAPVLNASVWAKIGAKYGGGLAQTGNLSAVTTRIFQVERNVSSTDGVSLVAATLHGNSLSVRNLEWTDTLVMEWTVTGTAAAYVPAVILNGAINSAVTTVALTGGTPVATGDIIVIDTEKMLVTAGGGTATLTVTRGYQSTAASHADLAPITQAASVAFTVNLYHLY